MSDRKPSRHATQPRPPLEASPQEETLDHCWEDPASADAPQAPSPSPRSGGRAWQPSQERRQQPRIPLRIFCEIHDGVITHLGHTCDGSLRGFGTAPVEELKLGRIYQATLHDGIQRIHCRVRLVRAEPDLHGFQIHDIEPAQRRSFRRLLVRHAYQHSPQVGRTFEELLQKHHDG